MNYRLLLLIVAAAPIAVVLLCASDAPADDMSARFRAGMMAMQQASTASPDKRDELLDKAIAEFRAMLVANPRLVRVRLEFARAFFLEEEGTPARRHFEIVLAGKPPAGAALNVNRFLAQIRARKRWSVRVGAALAPDSNISARTDEKTILIDVLGQRLPFTYNAEDEPLSGVGIAAWAGGEYQYPLRPRSRFRAGGDISRREYRCDEFDRMTLS